MKKVLVLIAWLIETTLSFGQVLKTDVPAHDPVMIRQNGIYYMFCTGNGIAVWSSADMIHWQQQKPVFETAPQWAMDAIPGFKNHIWAPDISYHNGKYYLYYAVSVFGKNISCIGLATNKTLDPASPDFKWEDQGMVIQSKPGRDHWNAIDPNLVEDKGGTPYLAFGSFWDGIKLIKLNRDRTKPDQPVDHIPTIASRHKDTIKTNEPNPIEAPFIIHKGKYFYLFASIDYCCRGPKSTYKMIVGRSKKLTGPYQDTDGVPLKYGGGTILLAGDNNWYGVGHCAVTEFDGKYYLVFHGYDAVDNGKSKLRITTLKWEKDWPIVGQKVN